jgi:hypothetical protein
MRTTVGKLRHLIQEVSKDCWGGSHPEETYDEELVDEDDAYKKKSVYVPDDVKASIGKYFKAMGLSHPKKAKKRSRSS